MRTVVARNILHNSIDEVWALSEEKRINIVTEDGDVTTSGRAVIFSWFVWEFHRKFPSVPLLKEHVIPLKKFHKNTTLSFCNKVMWSVYSHLGESTNTYDLCKIAYDVINNIYNACVDRMGSYMIGASAIDYFDILNDDTIKNTIKNTPRDSTSLDRARADIEEYLKSPEHHQGNALKFICEVGIGVWNQMLQVIGFRGDCTDINSAFFGEPIMSSYARGITKLHESLMESRGGAKSIMSNEDPIKETEFFNKRMQLICQYVHTLIPGDCETTKYASINVTEENLKSLSGKWYIADDESLKLISKADKHLLDKQIKIRSSLYCKHRSNFSVCETCFGLLSDNVPDHTNLGQWCAIAFCSVITQGILSTKHVDGAAAAILLILKHLYERYVKVKGNGVYLVGGQRAKKIEITIPEDDIKHPEDLRVLKSINQHSVRRMSEIKTIGLSITDRYGMRTHQPIELALGKKPVHLSVDLLNHMRYKGWDETEDGSYLIDISDFDQSLPIITLPKLHKNMLEYMYTISEFIESIGDKGTHAKLKDYTNASEALEEFSNLVSEKIESSISHLEIFILAFMIRNKDDGRIPHINEPVNFESLDSVIFMRSASASLVYKDQSKWLRNYTCFDGDTRPPHPMDGLICPSIFNDK